jgi:uncharacterized protein GlcG (DUF336 family)
MVNLISRKSVSYGDAARMVEAALLKAKELGCSQSIAVVDCGGNLLAFGRMDAAPILGIEGAQRKAYTSLLGVGTEAFYDAIKNHAGTVHGLSSLTGSIMVPGGLPIIFQGETVGGIGASGGMPEEDVACAQAGLDAIAN